LVCVWLIPAIQGAAVTHSTASVTPPADLGSDSGGEEQLHYAVNKKIAKPRGQAGHPGSGGYSLDVVLRKWGLSLIGDVNVSD
jgi:hypothetical protein